MKFIDSGEYIRLDKGQKISQPQKLPVFPLQTVIIIQMQVGEQINGPFFRPALEYFIQCFDHLFLHLYFYKQSRLNAGLR